MAAFNVSPFPIRILLSVSLLLSLSACAPRLVYPVVTGSGPINGDTIERYDTIAVLNLTDAPGAPTSGTTVASLLATLLGDTGITIVERTRLEQIFEEQKRQLTSSEEKVDALKVGRLAGAKAVVVGDVGRWQSNGQVSNVSTSLRMVDVETGAILYNGIGYWPEPINAPPETAAMKVLFVMVLRLSEKIGTGTGGIGVVIDLRIKNGTPVFFVRKVLPKYPAEVAGLQAEDIILTCNGFLTEKWKTKIQFAKACHADGGQPMTFEVARGDQRLLIKATAVELLPR